MSDKLDVFEFFQKFSNEKACEQYIIQARWPRGIYCPNCHNHRIYRIESQKRFKCGKCRKQFTVRTGTILAESKLPLQKWLMAVWLLTTHRKGFSSVQLSKTLGVTQKTAWFLAHRIREAFTEGSGGLFNGEIEVDETYMGGKEKNKHQNKKLNMGRGPAGKIAVVGIRQRKGKIKSVVVKDTTSKTLHGLINKHVQKGALVYTDDHRAYQNLLNFNHRVVKHSVGEYVKDMASTNSVESFWALLKRGFIGVYHQMSPAHLHRYVEEFTFRQNCLHHSDESIMSRVFYNSNGKYLNYKQLTNAS